ncbi:MAG TPA: hypothetical protein VF727_12765 [Allosphingosinicella sp.]|jgi:hypothetical protein
MPSSIRPAAFILPLLAAACGRGEGEVAAANNASLEAGDPLLDNAAQVDPADLANEAAADEAADMDVYGGNAAAGETESLAPNANRE